MDVTTALRESMFVVRISPVPGKAVIHREWCRHPRRAGPRGEWVWGFETAREAEEFAREQRGCWNVLRCKHCRP